MNKKLRDKLRFSIHHHDGLGWIEVEAAITIKQVGTLTYDVVATSSEPKAIIDLALETLQESVANEMRALLEDEA